MVIVQEIPININNAINEKNGIFRKKELIVGGKPFEFFWIETFETVQMINTRQTLYYYYLTVAFLPNTVSQEFMRIAENLQISGTSAKAFLTINTEKPKKVQRLFDGSFTITWQVLNRAEIFQKKIDWLQANLS
ncbi:MAG: hypothetical protein K1X72_03330 [Pyrinomonadaceae bacterium]|nr:hypothetical protein [Pyrinomonadaceae bacterium]